jgi:hypothetical protein
VLTASTPRGNTTVTKDGTVASVALAVASDGGKNRRMLVMVTDTSRVGQLPSSELNKVGRGFFVCLRLI